MAFLITPEDLKTHVYDEISQEISRTDMDIIQRAINAGIAEAKGYCNRYDLAAVYGTATTDPVIIDDNLRDKVLDLVKWKLVKLANPNIDYAAAKENYQMAIEYYFKAIQAGKYMPEGWPYTDTSNDPAPPEGDSVYYSSNPKQRHFF